MKKPLKIVLFVLLFIFNTLFLSKCVAPNFRACAYDDVEPYYDTLEDSEEVRQWVEDAKRLKENVEEQINIKVSDFVQSPSEEIKQEIKRDLDTLYYENASLAYGINGAIYGTFGHTFNSNSAMYAGFYKDSSGRYHTATCFTNPNATINGNAFCPLSTDQGSFVVKYRDGNTPLSGRWTSIIEGTQYHMFFQPVVGNYASPDIYFNGDLVYSLPLSFYGSCGFFCVESSGVATCDLPQQANMIIVTNYGNAKNLFGYRTTIPTTNLTGKDIFSFGGGSVFAQLRDDSPNPEAWIEPEVPPEPTEAPTLNPNPDLSTPITLPVVPDFDADLTLPDGAFKGARFWFEALTYPLEQLNVLPYVLTFIVLGVVLYFIL